MKKILPFILILSILAGCGGSDNEQNSASLDPEMLYKQKCASCHGAELEGIPSSQAPALTNIGSKLSKEEIEQIIIDGVSNMPAGLYKGSDAAAVAEWLAEKK